MNAEELLASKPAEPLSRHLHIEMPGQRILTQNIEQDFIDVINAAIHDKSGRPHAFVLTKPPETVLVLWVPGLERPFLCFDSHSQSGQGSGGVTLKWFVNREQLAAELSK